MRLSIVLLCFLALLPLRANEPVDLQMINRIRQEAFQNSKVMEMAEYMAEMIGPRLSGSPAMMEANQWTRDKLTEMGLENAVVEPWGEFGQGWTFSRTAIHMLTPHQTPLFALPKAWTPGTKGPIVGTAMKLKLSSEADLEKWKGKLKGKILFLDDPKDIKVNEDSDFHRFDDHELEEREEFPIRISKGPPAWRARMKKRVAFRKKFHEFLEKEGVVAIVNVSSRNHGIIRLGGGGSRFKDESAGVTALMMMAEHYNKVLRFLRHGKEVTIEIDVKAQFHGDDLMGYNTYADIPGTDKKDEIVMAGAHLDSWHAATGATDNAAQCAIIMEAVRILKELDVKPRRTIRVALWSGEEQGLLGSRAFVQKYLAARPEPTDPEQKKLSQALRDPTGPLEIKPGHEKFSAYFNLDNGSGRIRGVYTQENIAIAPIFKAWLEPFEDIGASSVTTRNTGGTDHQAFDSVGLPGFQFIQDRLNYFTQTHHTHLDVIDYVPEEDLAQASAILASFLYHAATRDELMPREPMPRD